MSKYKLDNKDKETYMKYGIFGASSIFIISLVYYLKYKDMYGMRFGEMLNFNDKKTKKVIKKWKYKNETDTSCEKWVKYYKQKSLPACLPGSKSNKENDICFMDSKDKCLPRPIDDVKMDSSPYSAMNPNMNPIIRSPPKEINSIEQSKGGSKKKYSKKKGIKKNKSIKSKKKKKKI